MRPSRSPLRRGQPPALTTHWRRPTGAVTLPGDVSLDPRDATFKLWRLFCRGVVRVFYRRVEIHGADRLPASGPLIVCANHLNALADPIILQAFFGYPLHPLARSGLFRNPLMRPLLWLARAIPVYRRRAPAGAPGSGDMASKDMVFGEIASGDTASKGMASGDMASGDMASGDMDSGDMASGDTDTASGNTASGDAAFIGAAPRDTAPGGTPADDPGRNDQTFRRASAVLAEGGAILIFPEGESHSDPHLKPLKTGAARIAAAARREHGIDVPLLPMSLTFTRRGRFRSSVLIQVGRPIPWSCATAGDDDDAAVRALTEEVEAGLRAITLNVDSWADLDFLNRLDRFYRLRRGKRPDARPLSRRFRALQKMISVHRSLTRGAPEQVESVRRRLRRFEHVCRLLGARDYDLVVERRPLRFALDLLPRLAPALLALPVAIGGWITSAPPFFVTRWLGPRLARRADQYDTSKILLGMALFALWWGAQVWWIHDTWGWRWALGWAALLGPLAAVAWTFARFRRRIVDDLRAFVVLRSRRDATLYLRARRDELEVAIAELARLAKALPAPADATMRSAASRSAPMRPGRQRAGSISDRSDDDEDGSRASPRSAPLRARDP